MTLESRFKKIYTDKTWITHGGVSVSGSGSEVDITEVISSGLRHFIELNQIKSVIDCPCGDFNWQQQWLSPDMKYYGYDIVPEVIEIAKKNGKAYPNAEFDVANLCDKWFPEADLMLVRDCLVHLSHVEALAAMRNIAAQRIKYVAITSFVNTTDNMDRPSPEWRFMNLQKPPFNLPMPIAILVEQCPEADGAADDKSLYIYRVDQIQFVP